MNSDCCECCHTALANVYVKGRTEEIPGAEQSTIEETGTGKQPTMSSSVSIIPTAEGKNVLSSVRDPWHFGTDPDPDLDPYLRLTDADFALFVSDLQDADKK